MRVVQPKPRRAVFACCVVLAACLQLSACTPADDDGSGTTGSDTGTDAGGVGQSDVTTGDAGTEDRASSDSGLVDVSPSDSGRDRMPSDQRPEDRQPEDRRQQDTGQDRGVDRDSTDRSSSDIDASDTDASDLGSPDAETDTGLPIPECPHGIHTGDLFISSADDPDLPVLQGVSCLMGSAYIEDTLLSTLTLPNLVYVRDGFRVSSNRDLTSLSLPALERVDQVLHLGNNRLLADIGLDALLRAKDIEIRDNPALVTLTFPAFEHGEEDFDIIDNDALTTLTAPELETAGYIEIMSARLETLSFPKLTETSSLWIRGWCTSCGLTEPLVVNLPELRQITGRLLYTYQRYGVDLTLTLPKLETVSTLEPTSSQLVDISCPSLTRVRELLLNGIGLEGWYFPELAEVIGDADIRNNGDGATTFPKLVSIGGDFELHGWDATHTFPKLTTVDGRMMVSATSATFDVLESVDMLDLNTTVAWSAPSLAVVERLTVRNTAWTDLSAVASLDVTEFLSLSDNDEMITAIMPVPTGVTNLSIWNHDKLEEFGFPALRRARYPDIERNTALARFDLSELEEAHHVTFKNNQALPQCRIDALVEQLGDGHTGLTSFYGNNPTCDL